MKSYQMLELHFLIVGVLLIALALMHLIFPFYFNWKVELKQLSLINKQMMKVHTFFVAFTVFLMGILCLHSSASLINTQLGRIISLGLGVFWVVRLGIQFFGYSKKLWKGKTFETIVHIIFSILWLYFSTIFIINYLQK